MIEILGSGWVRFRFEEATDSTAFLVGDFNDWDETSLPMARQDDGGHIALLHLEPGSYQFKYKTGSLWFNDRAAHEYARNPWGSENSVVSVPIDPLGATDAAQQPSPPPAPPQ